MSIVEDYTGDESDDEREKKDILQRMEYFNRLFVVASSSVQLYYEKYILRQSCMDSTQSGTGAKVSQCRERFQRSGSTISRHFAVVLEKVSRMATDLIAPEDPFFSSIPEQIRNDSRYMSHFKVQLMVLTLRLFFHQMNKFPILEEKVSRLKMLWQYVILICVSHLSWLDGKDRHMTLEYFLKQFEIQNTNFRTFQMENIILLILDILK
ncbi:uncharacterized protein [Gossypium hirsutum]|uniref:Uncharacterized protein isoform X2 n=1 Tax=Gossypium hirsutum TaxID=3635 RepID=A0ABM2ZLY3_GOSHI|nr:uncharacterized protein LOC107922301 isoform X2 [Gossypium hirsutum]